MNEPTLKSRGQRLTRAEESAVILYLQHLDTLPQLTDDDRENRAYYWNRLAGHHFNKMHLNCSHAADIVLSEVLREDAGGAGYSMAEYLEHYSAEQLRLMSNITRSAWKTLLWFSDQLAEEQRRRDPEPAAAMKAEIIRLPGVNA